MPYITRKKRPISDLIEIHNIMLDLEGLNSENFSELNQGSTKGHPLKIFKQRSRLLNSRKYFSQKKIVGEWNNSLKGQFWQNQPTVLKEINGKFYFSRSFLPWSYTIRL